MTRSISACMSVILTIAIFTSCRHKSITVITTAEVTEVSYTGASSGGIVENKKGYELKSRGICWSLSPEPSLKDKKTDEGLGKGGFASSISGLEPGTTYYIRAYAIKDVDTIYGNIISFSTKGFGKLTDIEGNNYRTITIGSQTWMAENLRASRYNDSTPIPNVKDGGKWAVLTTPALCWYKNSEAAFKPIYGAMYNWYTVNTRKLCPSGWHVPSSEEWTALSAILGGEEVAGGKLKEKGEAYWSIPNEGATNEYRFTALPGGLRYSDGEFRDFGFGGYWWTSSELSEDRAYFLFLFYQDAKLFRFDNSKKNGFYVRCIKD